MRKELPTYGDRWETSSELVPSLPSGWCLKRLKFLMPNVTVGIVITPSKYYVDSGVPAIRSLNVKDGRIVPNDLVYFAAEDSERLRKTQIHTGDVVIVRTGQTGASAVVDLACDGWNCIDLIIVRRSNRLRSVYLQYYFKSRVYEAQVHMKSDGAIQQHFNIGLVKELLIVEPPLADQRAIVSFLDAETGKIDRLVGVRRRQIAVLREQRAAVIHHAVTQGLDPAAPMKDSGIEWLGETIREGKAYRIKNIARVVAGGTPKSGEPSYWEGDVTWLTPADLGKNDQTEILNSARNLTMKGVAAANLEILPAGSLVISTRAPVGSLGMLAAPATTNQGCKGLVFDLREVEPRYFYFLVQSAIPYLNACAQGATFVELSGFQIRDMKIVLPRKQNQRAIVSHIDRETAKIDALIGKYGRELELLEEYRSSLISHAVTGKIDLRGIVNEELGIGNEEFGMGNGELGLPIAAEGRAGYGGPPARGSAGVRRRQR